MKPLELAQVPQEETEIAAIQRGPVFTANMGITPGCFAQKRNFNVPAIYAIAHIPTFRLYIGSTIFLWRRWKHHLRELFAQKHHSVALQRAWNKHGASAFGLVVLEIVANEEDMLSAERRWIEQCKPAFNCMGVDMERGVFRHTASAKAKMSRSQIERGAARKASGASRHSEETKRKMAIAATGRKHTSESIVKMRAAKLNNPMPREELARRARLAIAAHRRKRTAELTEEFGSEKANMLMAKRPGARYMAIRRLRNKPIGKSQQRPRE